MSDTTQPDALPEETQTPVAAPELPDALKNVDPGKLELLREKLAKFTSSNKTTISGSEAVADAPGSAAVNMGKDVDWSEYNLEFNVRHLYPQATFRDTPEGPKWVAMVDEFYSLERSWMSHRKSSSDGNPMNLGEYLNDMLNSPEGWRIISILPGSTGRVGILLQRQVPVILPDPTPLKKETEVEAPTDVELQRTEDAALAFASEVGLTPAEAVSEDEGGEAVGEPTAQ